MRKAAVTPIGFILIWMVGAAICVAVDQQGESAARSHWYWQFQKVALSLAHGAALGALILWGLRIGPSHTRIPRQPGHWALLLSALWWLFEVAQSASWAWLHGSELLLLMACFQVLMALAFLAASAAIKHDACWSWVFIVSGLRSGIQAGLYCLETSQLSWLSRYLQIPNAALVCLAVLVAIMFDVSNHVRRDFLHWIGVIQFFFVNALWATNIWVGRLPIS